MTEIIMVEKDTYLPTYRHAVREAAPKTVFKRAGKLEIHPLLVQAFGITPEEIIETINASEEPEAMRDMFAFLSDYAALSDPRTRSAITDEKLDFLVADLKRRMAHVAEFYREQAIEYSKLIRFMEHVKVRKLQMADRLQRISEEARKLSAFSGQTRTDKVAFIDAVAHLEHTTGSVIPIAFGISDYGREDYWPRKLLEFLRTPGMGMARISIIREATTPVTEPANKEFKANPSLINKTAAQSAYRGTSFDPERRAEQAISGFAQEVQAVYERLKPYARTDRQKALLIAEMERFQASYAQKYNELLYSHASIVSPMIAGPSKFPAERMRKTGQAYDTKAQETYEWKDRAQKAMLRALKELAIEEAGGEVAVLKNKLAQAEKLQEMMVEANKIIRKKPEPGIGGVSKQQQLVNLGFTETQAAEALTPDFAGRLGFSYQLTNNSAEIRRLKARIAELEKKEVTPTAEIPFTGGRIVDNRDLDRVQIIFDQKPPQEVINKLKSEGWRWSPSNMAWQRKRTEYAMTSARRITGAAQPPAPPVPMLYPAPQPQAVPELRWVYGTLSGKWHLVGAEDRDYAHGITQERMKIIGQEAAKAEYLSPALARAAAPVQQVSAVRPPMLYPAPEVTPPRPAEEIMTVSNPETLTKEEFVKEKYKRMAQVLRQQGKIAIAERIEKGARDPERTFKYETSHRDQVVLALAQGKTVSPVVLKDYPDIVARIRKENEAIIAKERAERERLLAIERAEENELNAELNKLPPPLKRHAETEIYSTLHLPETHKDYRNRFYIALGKVRRIAFAHLPHPEPIKEEPVEPLSPEYERVLKAYLEGRGHELKLQDFIWADKYTIRGTAKYAIRTMEEKRRREEFILKNYNEETGKKFHRGTVISALNRGIKVPDEVLKDYPDLMKKEVPEPTGYFSLRKAQELIRENNSKLSDEQLHKKSIQLRDYIRFIEIPDEYSRKTLVKGGYYEGVIDQYVTGVVPVDPFLHQNLKSTLDEVYKEQQRRKQEQTKKEPWEMTQEEYWRAGAGGKAFEGRGTSDYNHKQAVHKAISEGKPVSAKVLKDYPDMMKKEVPVPPKIPAVAVPPVAKPVTGKFVQTTFQVQERMRRYGYA